MKQIIEQVAAARAGVEASRKIAGARPIPGEANDDSLAREVKELRLALDRAIYAVELLAREVSR